MDRLRFYTYVHFCSQILVMKEVEPDSGFLSLNRAIALDRYFSCIRFQLLSVLVDFYDLDNGWKKEQYGL